MQIPDYQKFMEREFDRHDRMTRGFLCGACGELRDGVEEYRDTGMCIDCAMMAGDRQYNEKMEVELCQ